MRSFEIYGKWSVQTSIDTHTHAQCSHASVGLAQARPNHPWSLAKCVRETTLADNDSGHPALVAQNLLVMHGHN